MHDDIRAIHLRSVMCYLGISMEPFKRRSGKEEWYGPCPFHEPKSNKTSFSFTGNVFHCFSCEVKGKGAIDFVMAYRKCNFKDATTFLKSFSQGTPPAPVRENLPTSEPVLENKPFKGSYEKFYQPCEWLESRIPDNQVLESYRVGLYQNPSRKSLYSGKVMFPIRRLDGVCVGYLARNIDSDPKYLFPSGFHKHLELYGAWELSQSPLPLRLLYLVESPFCVLKFAMYGLPAVSPFGWSVSPQQVQTLTQLARGVVYLPDRNKYPECAKVVQSLAQAVWVRVPIFPEGIEDPEHLSREQILALTK